MIERANLLLPPDGEVGHPIHSFIADLARAIGAVIEVRLIVSRRGLVVVVSVGRGRFVARDFFRITVAAGRVPLAPEVVRLASLVAFATRVPTLKLLADAATGVPTKPCRIAFFFRLEKAHGTTLTKYVRRRHACRAACERATASSDQS